MPGHGVLWLLVCDHAVGDTCMTNACISVRADCAAGAILSVLPHKDAVTMVTSDVGELHCREIMPTACVSETACAHASCIAAEGYRLAMASCARQHGSRVFMPEPVQSHAFCRSDGAHHHTAARVRSRSIQARFH